MAAKKKVVSTPSVGSVVMFKQRDEWLPMIVTHVHDTDMISGVALSGLPARAGWSRGGQEFAIVSMGTDNRNWRYIEAAKEEGPTPDAGKDENQ